MSLSRSGDFYFQHAHNTPLHRVCEYRPCEAQTCDTCARKNTGSCTDGIARRRDNVRSRVTRDDRLRDPTIAAAADVSCNYGISIREEIKGYVRLIDRRTPAAVSRDTAGFRGFSFGFLSRICRATIARARMSRYGIDQTVSARSLLSLSLCLIFFSCIFLYFRIHGRNALACRACGNLTMCHA